MAFRPANLSRLVKFNSAASSKFIDMYESYLDKEIEDKNNQPKHKTFAPSSFRCPRISWFRLRGVQPDKVKSVDRTLQFVADIGTSCHDIIQTRLEKSLGQDWVDVEKYLESIDFGSRYTYKVEKSKHETLIEIQDPPVRFACDGIVNWMGELYLLEIKSSEFGSFDELTDPKTIHEDQVKFYCTLLGLSKVLFLYIDRQYGGLKCYEVHVSELDKQNVLDRLKYVQDMVKATIAPERLPKGDSWCTPSMCPYYEKCKQWG